MPERTVERYRMFVSRCLRDRRLDLRLSELRHLGNSPDDGERFVLEVAARDRLGACPG